MEISQLRAAFPELEDIVPLGKRGGQKSVYKARRGATPVALKLIHDHSADAADRTDREILAVRRIASPYIPTVFDAGHKNIAGDVRHYIVEEFVSGDTLRDRLTGGPFPLKDVLHLGDVLLSACADCEAVNVVHRDIKPENIMIDASEKIWLVDFGFSRALDLASLTPSGLYGGVGTLGYAPPEQFRNTKAEINSRADLYSVGIVLYEASVGYNPWRRGRANPAEVIHAMESEELPGIEIPGDQSGELSRFILWLTRRFPSRRPQSASDACRWFNPILKKLKDR